MRYGLVGWATASGLGSLNVDLARNARGLARWLIPDDAAVAPHPAYVDAVPVETMFCRAAGDEPAYARFLDGLDAVVFFEVPYLQDFDLVGECRRRGIVTCCIPNWEWFPETGWSEGVDMLWCPTAYTADVARAMAARRPYRWAARIFGSRWGIDTARFPFRERGPVRRFVFANGSGGYAMRKGADALHAVARLVPEASFLFYTQNGNHPTPMPPNVEVRQDRLSQRADLYAEGDVFLSLSRWEGIGLPAYEAQACGLPVACADAPPMAECGADFLLPATAPTTVRILDRDVPRWEIDTVYLARLLRDLAGADVSARSRAASARVRARHDVTGVLEEFEASLARVCAEARPSAAARPAVTPRIPAAPPDRPLAALAVAARDAAASIGAAIESALAQTYRPLAIVVVDDASADGTETVLDRYRDRAVVHVLPRRAGLAAARNAALRLLPPETRYVAVLDGGDRLDEHFVERAVAHLDRWPETGVVCPAEIDVDARGRAVAPPFALQPWDFESWIGEVRGRGPAWLARYDVVMASGLYDETWPYAEDVDLVGRLFATTRFRTVPDALIYRPIADPPGSGRAREWLRCHVACFIGLGYAEAHAYRWAEQYPDAAGALDGAIARGMEIRARRRGEARRWYPYGATRPAPVPVVRASAAVPIAAPPAPARPRAARASRRHAWRGEDLAVNGGPPVRERMLVGAPQLGEAAVEAAAAVIRSGWLGAGPKVVEFEERFAAHVGARHAVAVSSGTAALFLSLVALGVGRGNEVITTPLTAAATANAIEQTGAVPVFADVDPRTLTLDPGAVAGAVTARTKAIVAVHVGGQPCAMAELHAIARRHDLVVVEDAADALGASYRGRPIGGLGGTAAFSFGDEAAIVTGGGGMVTTDDATLAAELRLLRAHGTATSTWQRLHGDAGTSAEVQGPGYRAELSDVAAALALAQLPAQPAGLRARAEIAARYDEALAPLRVARPAPAAGGDVHAHGRYLALLEPGGWRIDRTRVVDALRKEHIGAGVYRALHTHSFYRSRVRAETAACVHAEDVGGRLFTLPLAAGMTEADVDDVIAALEKLAAVYAS